MKNRASHPFAATLALLFLLALAFPAVAKTPGPVFQVSTIDALLAGVFDGSMTFGELKSHGDFGLGTVNALDGEMVAVDGVFYQVAVDGTVRVIQADETTPFADVAFFSPEQSVKLAPGLDLEALKAALDAALPSPNLFYAVRVDGMFPSVVTRSVPRQEKPYPTLTEAAKKQNVFHFDKIDGSLIAFRFPDNVGGMGVPGWHLHFIGKDRARGGHVLDLRTGEAMTANIDTLAAYEIVLPASGEFLTRNPGAGKKQALEAVEKK